MLDGMLIAIMLISALLAMVRGFAREILSIVSWATAAVAAFFLYPSLLPFVKGYISNPQISLGISVAVIFFITLIIVSYVTMRISDFILDSRIGALDRDTSVFVFGAGRGLLLVVVAMLFFNWFVPERSQPNWIARAKSKPILNSIGEQLVAVLPEDPESEIFERLRNRNANTAPGEQSRAPSTSDPGYQTGDRRGLNQLIKSSDKLVPRTPQPADKFREECGVFGVFGHDQAAALTTLGLHALQHRGQEAAGIVSFDGQQFHPERHIGLVGDNFTDQAVIDRLKGAWRHRPYALLHHWCADPAQCAAPIRRICRRRFCRRP